MMAWVAVYLTGEMLGPLVAQPFLSTQVAASSPKPQTDLFFISYLIVFGFVVLLVSLQSFARCIYPNEMVHLFHQEEEESDKHLISTNDKMPQWNPFVLITCLLLVAIVAGVKSTDSFAGVVASEAFRISPKEASSVGMFVSLACLISTFIMTFIAMIASTEILIFTAAGIGHLIAAVMLGYGTS
jgi:hypothetical protein